MNIGLCNDMAWILSREAFDVYRDCMYLPTYEKYVEDMKDFIQSPSGKVYLCCDETKVVGILLFRLLCQQAAEIKGIAVSKQYRKYGIGKRLIVEAKKAEGLKISLLKQMKRPSDFIEAVDFR